MFNKFYNYLWLIVLLLCVHISLVHAQGVQINGTVLDETDMPLPCVTVLVKGTTTGTTTGLDGKYSFEGTSK